MDCPSLVGQPVHLFGVPIPFLCIYNVMKAVFARVTQIFATFYLSNMTFLPQTLFLCYTFEWLWVPRYELSVTQIPMSKCHWCARDGDWKRGKQPQRRTRWIPFIMRPSSLISLQRTWTRSASLLQWWIMTGKHSSLSDHWDNSWSQHGTAFCLLELTSSFSATKDKATGPFPEDV